MFTNLHLGQHKGLKGGWLRNLGRINIICGKNNSGKSTVLEAINFTTSSSPGLQLTDGELSQIFTNCLPNFGWSRDHPYGNTRFREIENYFSPRALREIFGAQIPDSVSTIDPEMKLEKQIGIDVKRNNRKLAKAMMVDEIKESDLYDFLLQVKTLCEKPSHVPS